MPSPSIKFCPALSAFKSVASDASTASVIPPPDTAVINSASERDTPSSSFRSRMSASAIMSASAPAPWSSFTIESPYTVSSTVVALLSIVINAPIIVSAPASSEMLRSRFIASNPSVTVVASMSNSPAVAVEFVVEPSIKTLPLAVVVFAGVNAMTLVSLNDASAAPPSCINKSPAPSRSNIKLFPARFVSVIASRSSVSCR